MPLNGSLGNYAAHAALSLALGGVMVFLTGSPLGLLLGSLWFIAKEAGEFSAKHPEAPGRPWADLNPLHALRTKDDKRDWFSGVVPPLVVLLALVLF
ncbi:hypothetical protein BSL82_03440 [Tardibacter chloracetimidivorans]|uniref:Uncharacterized protein n=1 Tax=Tardibacter chloracetimidivorans TaxID=1921510 RepID=A0A1L3ZS57_9SPHN|nr:hypothetical protein BSL82_03440 [Tardibacter chloracetimidivorans]